MRKIKEKNITVADIIKICNGKLIQGNLNSVCQNFSKDTREIKQGEFYVGIQGENFNGSELYEQAFEKGAIGCLLQKVEIKPEIIKKYPNSIIILVENTVTALQQLAMYKRKLYNIPVVAITGSVGKTSTKDMIASVLSQKYKVVKTQGNYNNEIGLPLTILKLRDEQAMVLEMGMNSFGEISLLTKIAKPDVAVITNIGTAHIGCLGSRENILKAKLEILEGLNEKGTVVINYDNDLLNKWFQEQKQNYKIITYGLKEQSNIFAKNIQFKGNESEYEVKINEKQYTVNVPVGGEHFVLNSLCAISVAQIFDIPMENVLKGINKFDLSKKRMEIKIGKNGETIINDCYNANYDSMKAGLDYLKNLPNKRKIAVLGDMLELGKHSTQLHEKVGEIVAKNNINILICVGKEAESIAKNAEENGMKKENIYICSNNKQAILILQSIINKQDSILIKASNSMNFTEICEAIC